MTITSEMRAHTYRRKISQTLLMVNRLVRWEYFTSQATIVARVDADSDHELRLLLTECSEFWEFDTDDMVLRRKFDSTFGDGVGIEIGVASLLADDVYRIIADTEPPF